MRRIALALGIASLSLSAGAEASCHCTTNLATLVSVHSNRQVSYRSITLPPPPVAISEDLAVSQGGAATLMRMDVTCCQLAPPTRTFVSGVLTSAQFTGLRAALQAASIAQLADCVVENDPTQAIRVDVFGSYELTWNDGATAEHRFTVVHANPGDSELPQCGPAALQLETALATFEPTLRAGLHPLQCLGAPEPGAAEA